MSVVDRINRVSVPHKIIGVFFAILLLVGGLSAISIGRVAATNGAIHELIDDHVSSLTFLDEMRSAVAQYRARLNRGIWSIGAVADPLASLDALEHSFRDSQARYEQTVWGNDEAAIDARLKPLVTAFFAHGKDVAAALRESHIDVAKGLLLNDLIPAADSLDDVLRESFRFNSEGALTDASLVAESIERGLLNWIVVLIAVIVFIAAAAVFLFESIVRPNQRLGDAMHGGVGGRDAS